MEQFKSKFTRIKGSFSQVRRMPRLGKIRLGVKVQKLGKNGPVEYPKETPHFVVPEEVAAVYGPEPTELDVMLPHDDPEVVFQQKYAMYGQTAGLKCHGNGEQAERLNEKGEWVQRTCPCEFLKTDENPQGQCTEQSHLMVVLPKVSMGGCFQITTRSYHSTVTINSALDYIRALAGRIAMLPLKLRREPRETHHNGKKQTHHTLNLILDATIQDIKELRADPNSLIIPAQYQLEGPVDENPVLDPADEVEVNAEELADMSEAQLAEAQAKFQQQRGNGALGGVVPATAQVPPGNAPPSDLHTVISDYRTRIKDGVTVQEATAAHNEAQRDKNIPQSAKVELSQVLQEKLRGMQSAKRK